MHNREREFPFCEVFREAFVVGILKEDQRLPLLNSKQISVLVPVYFEDSCSRRGFGSVHQSGLPEVRSRWIILQWENGNVKMLLHSHVCISSSIRHHQLHSNSENATSLCLTHQQTKKMEEMTFYWLLFTILTYSSSVGHCKESRQRSSRPWPRCKFNNSARS